MEAIGDITASAEVSRVRVEGEDFESRIQGGVLVGTHLSQSFDRLIYFERVERRYRWLLVCSVHRDTAVDLRTGECRFITSIPCI